MFFDIHRIIVTRHLADGNITPAKIQDRTRRLALFIQNDGGISNNEGGPEGMWTGASPQFVRASGIIPMDVASGTTGKLVLVLRDANGNNNTVNYYVGIHGDSQGFTSWNIASNATGPAMGLTANQTKYLTVYTIGSSDFTAGKQIGVALKPNGTITGSVYIGAVFLEYTADS